MNFFSSEDTSPYGKTVYGPGMLDHAEMLSQIIKKDTSLGLDKKQTMLSLLNDPDFVYKIIAGYTGSQIMDLIAQHKKMSPTSKFLLSAAGFSLGSALYKIFMTEAKHLKYNEQKTKYTVK